MTSKISCEALTAEGDNVNNNLTKFNSLNVTGITTNSSSSSNNSSNQLIKPSINTTFADPVLQSPFSYNISQNAIYSPITPSPSTVSPLSNNIVEEEDDEIQSSIEQDEEFDADEANEDNDDDTDNEKGNARKVFERVEERLRDSGIDFDISSMLD
jgi:hypothetical protein